MKTSCTMLAITALFLSMNPSRSQEVGTSAERLEARVSVGTIVPAQPETRSLSLPQRIKEWGKLRLVKQPPAAAVESADPAVPQSPAEPLPAPQAVPAPVPDAAAGVACFSGPAHRCCWEQLDDWLTYRPVTRSCCDCLPRCAPCCPPPLYTFFIGTCCVNSAGAGCGAPCGGFGGCGPRPVGRRFQLWQGWDAFFFNHPKVSDGGTCVPDKKVAEIENR